MSSRADSEVDRLYRERYDTYLHVLAERVELQLGEYLEGIEHIDRISARAKLPDRFSEKASRTATDGRPRYTEPLEEIQDQLGARITVLYLSDVPIIEAKICQYLQPIESQSMTPESEWEFGYFGHHLMVAMPHDLLRRDIPREGVPEFFEIQIKTVFQHAWSESNHDLGYKAASPLTKDQSRWLAFAASQAWGADHAVNELVLGLAPTAAEDEPG